ncbi:hypothetical protein AgCh_012891 [Apium graveolens]
MGFASRDVKVEEEHGVMMDHGGFNKFEFSGSDDDGISSVGIATVHPKCQTRFYPPNEDNPPDSRTGDPKLLGAKCRMTPKFSNEDTR